MALAGLLAAATVAGGDCAALRAVPLQQGEVRSAELAGGICRVTAQLRPAKDSEIGVTVWLPASGWTGRYVQLGTGGFAGTLPTEALAHEARRGNAMAVTDTGHVAGAFDASWALGRPEKVVDYGHRSLKVSADAARAIAAAFYGRAPAKRYFVGCSNGGRQALMAAQRWPGDWDGLLVGSPALAWTEQMSALARIQHVLRATPGAMIPAAKLPTIEAAARAQCGDRAQGRPCRLDTQKLGLTKPQAAALKLIVGEFDARWATAPDGWSRWIVGEGATRTQLDLAEPFFRNMVVQKADFRIADLRPAHLRQAGRLSGALDAKGSLGAFRRRGGKLIVYVGSADPLIAPFRALDYYRREGRSDFARLYVAPGMGHCQGGAGPDSFGQSVVSLPLKPDTRHDMRRALEAWVEEGAAPGEIVAVSYGAGGVVTASTVMRPN